MIDHPEAVNPVASGGNLPSVKDHAVSVGIIREGAGVQMRHRRGDLRTGNLLHATFVAVAVQNGKVPDVSALGGVDIGGYHFPSGLGMGIESDEQDVVLPIGGKIDMPQNILAGAVVYRPGDLQPLVQTVKHVLHRFVLRHAVDGIVCVGQQHIMDGDIQKCAVVLLS